MTREKKDTRIGPTLHNLRKAACMTQRELAEKSGVTRTTINKIEGGYIDDVHVKNIVKLERALDCLGVLYAAYYITDDSEIEKLKAYAVYIRKMLRPWADM